ncbi:MAG TPA: hypothetical protein VE953_07770 [Terriglobales bacterium]|nr:hypothetical protein [Terriglobales bacterium]
MRNVVVGLALLCVCACGAVARTASTTGTAPAPSPLSAADLQYRLIDTVGAPVSCELSQGPVVRSEDPADVARMVAALRAQDPAEFDAIVRHEHLNAASLSPADDLRVVGQASVLAAVKLTPQGSGYGFAYEVQGPPTAEVSGTIDATGAIHLATRAAAPRRLCPL